METGERTTASFFAGELRRARVAAGLSQDQLGQMIAYSGSTVAMVETTKRTPNQDFAKRCDDALATNGLLSRIQEQLLAHDLAPEWFRPWISIEREATSLLSYEPLVFQGLLQTPDYARAVIRSAGDALSTEKVEQLVTARLERQELLNRENPPLLIAIVDEGVLRRPVGGPELMHRQLRHVANASERSQIVVQVVPLATGAYAGLAGPFVIASFDGSGEMVYLDTQLRGQVVERAADVAAVKQRWEALRAEAFSRKQSTELILEVAETWKT
jgi:transcriptional regulator with XRE-family HTH domain